MSSTSSDKVQAKAVNGAGKQSDETTDEAPLPLEIEAIDILLKVHATSSKHKLLTLRECGRLSVTNKTVSKVCEDNGLWKHFFEETVQDLNKMQRKGEGDITFPILDAYNKQQISQSIPDCIRNHSRELVDRVGYKKMISCLRGKECVRCEKMTGHADPNLFERICVPCSKDHPPADKKARLETLAGRSQSPILSPVGLVYRCKDCDLSGSLVDVMLHERLEHERDLFGYANGAPLLSAYSGPKDLARREEIPGITDELAKALSQAHISYETGSGDMGGGDEDDFDFDDYDYGVEMTKKNCLIAFNLPGDQGSGPAKETATISADYYNVEADTCGWGGLNICVQLGSGKVPTKLLRLGLGEESGFEMEASSRCFRDTIQQLRLGDTGPSQFLLALLATALPLDELEWIGEDMGFYEQGANYYVGGDDIGCSMPIYTRAMSLLDQGVKKPVRKVGEVIDLLDSDGEQDGDSGAGDVEDEVIVIE